MELGDPLLREMLRSASLPIREAASAFVGGIDVLLAGNSRRGAEWKEELRRQLQAFDLQDPDAVTEVNRLIAQLKEQVLLRDVRPMKYREVARVWTITLALLLLIQIFLGENQVLMVCKDWNWLLVEPCVATYGHLIGYIAFRYALYGVVIGNALLMSLRAVEISFDGSLPGGGFADRPGLNLVVASTIAYVLARLVAEGQLEFNLLGFKIGRQGAENAPFFTNSGSLFILGLAAAIASDIFLRRLVSTIRRSAEGAFGEA